MSSPHPSSRPLLHSAPPSTSLDLFFHRWPFSETLYMQNMMQNSNLQETNVHRIAITRKVYRSNEYETHNKNIILRISVRVEGEQCFEMSLHFCHHIKTLDYECCWNRSYILSIRSTFLFLLISSTLIGRIYL